MVYSKIHYWKSGELSSSCSNDQIRLNQTLDNPGEGWKKFTVIPPFLEIDLVGKSKWTPQSHVCSCNS